MAFAKIEKGEEIENENFRFHVLLAELSRNPILIMIVNTIVPIIAAFVEMVNPSLERSRSIPESHWEFLEEIKGRHVVSAKQKLDDQILFFSRS